MLEHSPADIIATLIIESSLGEDHASELDYPVRVGAEEQQDKPSILVTDTPGLIAGRDLGTGETRTRPGFQVRVRAQEFTSGYLRMMEIATAFDGVLQDVIQHSNRLYLIKSIHRSGGINYLGQDAQHYFLWTYNAVCIIKKVG